MAQSFKKGDSVKLKSGGPTMTIEGYKLITPYDEEAYEGDTHVECTWFMNQKLERATFHQDAVEMA